VELRLVVLALQYGGERACRLLDRHDTVRPRGCR
jgi:hypothetical protein